MCQTPQVERLRRRGALLRLRKTRSRSRSLGCCLNSAEARECEGEGVPHEARRRAEGGGRGIGARRLVDATDAACSVPRARQLDRSGHTRRDQRSRAAPFKARLRRVIDNRLGKRGLLTAPQTAGPFPTRTCVYSESILKEALTNRTLKLSHRLRAQS